MAIIPSPRVVQPPSGATLCVPTTAAVVEAIVVIPSLEHANLYALLQCDEDFEYGRKTYGGYIEVLRTLLAKDGESSPPASGNFQSTNV
jgi:hypothetical protein